MRNIFKKLITILTIFGFISTTVVFTSANAMEYKVKNNLEADVKGLKSRLTGTVDLSNVIDNEYHIKEGTTDTYVGEITGSVEAGDLFAGAYDEYTKLEQQKLFFIYWKNFVMFGKDENTFPNATYTVEFPKNENLKIRNVEVIENTNTISSVKKEVVDNKVNFTFNLGNWNDYGGFFDLVKPELKESGHNIDIKIQYEITIPNTNQENRIIKCAGACDVYYFGNKRALVSNPIVSITSPDILFKLSNLK